ncbi:hypothetical protein KIN20_036411 [Parelaphostrongylus tenuis]|uniref:Uncharacterized protein n=1 Tax=Parelaphostrongylus tenuis TaxID=148309 RepID=A0AAD5WL70_PARTN|nr:hypothetical protein KIN20_036411 [Parelaphostrongylus tenuis]
MDNAGGLTKKQITACLRPFAGLLGERSISDYLFDSIATEIFATILHQKSEELASETETNGDIHGESTAGIEFDYRAIGQMLFDIGKRPETISKRRKKLYGLVKKFDVAAKGGDPYYFKPPVPKMVLTRKDYEEAEIKLKKIQEETVRDRERMKLEKKRRKSIDTGSCKKARIDCDSANENESLETLSPSVNAVKTLKKKRKTLEISGIRSGVNKGSKIQSKARKRKSAPVK